MTPEQWKRVRELFHRALDLEPEPLAALLQEAERQDPDVVAHVRRLLAQVEPELEPDGGAAASPPAPDPTAEWLPAGRMLGDLELQDVLGRGAVGIVYRARQHTLDRVVAVKILRPLFDFGGREVDRFEREARAVARMRHPGIAQILAVGRQGDLHYFAMEYVAGNDLGVELARLRQETGTTRQSEPLLPPRGAPRYFAEVARVVADAADALQHAHDRGVVHRDVKPSNLLLDGEAKVRLVDFGIARGEGLGTITGAGEAAGTPYYMSPEQVRAERDAVDHRTDVYSLGVVLYELLTLKRPFDGPVATVLQKIEKEDAPDVIKVDRSVPRDLAVITQVAMRKEPRERYPSAAAFRDDLRRFLDHQAIQARPYTARERGVRWLNRHWRGAVVALLVLLTAVVTAAVAGHRGEERRLDGLARTSERGAAATDLEALKLTELREIREAARALAAALRPGDDRAQLAAALLARLDGLAADWLARGRTDLERSRDRTLDPGLRQTLRARGLLTVTKGTFLFPEREDFQELARIESIHPTLSVRAEDAAGRAIGAAVLLRAVDCMTGAVQPERSLGRAPIAGEPVQDGYYRLVVRFDAGGSRELIVAPGPAFMDLAVRAVRRDDEAEVGRGMIRFEGGTYRFPRDDSAVNEFAGKSVHLDPFLLDRTEVTNGEYRAFIEATGRARPRFWQYGYAAAQHDALPVTGITWNDAVAFAEWAGKRLPTYAEWSLAARGHEGRRAPWTSAPLQPLRGNVHGAIQGAGNDPARAWTIYVENAWPVTADQDGAASPEGVLHLLGNVDEYTETMMIGDTGAGVEQRIWDRVTVGAGWDAAARQQDLASHGFDGIGPLHSSYRRGFRCAKTVAE